MLQSKQRMTDITAVQYEVQDKIETSNYAINKQQGKNLEPVTNYAQKLCGYHLTQEK